MKNARILSLAAVLSSLMLFACSVNNSATDPKPGGSELVFSSEPEPVKGRLDVYNSMSRAAKYNVDVASQNLSKKIYNQNPNLKPKDIVDNMLNSNVMEGNKLYGASRVLEFATIYAVTSLNDKPEYVENNFYMKSSQHLALAAISLHQDTWFAGRKLKDIERFTRQEQKVLNELNKKMERDGSLNAADLNYKKNLEVALLKLSEIHKSLAYNYSEYSQLAKVDPQQIDLEGRKFFELEDFDRNFTVEIFQEAAVRNRNEFAIAKEQVRNYNFNEVRSKVNQDYPLIPTLDINGLTVSDEIYNNELQQKAVNISEQLLRSVTDYRLSKPGEDKMKAKEEAFDALAAAILTQVEVNFKLVELASTDYQDAEFKIAELQRAIKAIEKTYRPSSDQKLELLNNKISLLELERKKAQIGAERAVALRGLYFNAGFSPFNRTLLKAPIADIVAVLKTGFNKDIVDMLATASKQMNKSPADDITNWAKGNNWLEELVDGPNAVKVPTSKGPVNRLDSKADSRFAPYGAEANSLKTMQLGAYEQKSNALSDWDKLTERFSDLKKYNPKIMRAHGIDRGLFRLVVTSSKGGLREICNQMRAAETDCILK